MDCDRCVLKIIFRPKMCQQLTVAVALRLTFRPTFNESKLSCHLQSEKINQAAFLNSWSFPFQPSSFEEHNMEENVKVYRNWRVIRFTQRRKSLKIVFVEFYGRWTLRESRAQSYFFLHKMYSFNLVRRAICTGFGGSSLKNANILENVWLN